MQCVAQPAAAREALAGLDLDAAFSADLHRRAAAHLRRGGASALPPDGEDQELASFMAGLALRAAEIQPTRASLDADLLKLRLADLERRIVAARHTGAPLAQLAAERERLKASLTNAHVPALEESYSD